MATLPLADFLNEYPLYFYCTSFAKLRGEEYFACSVALIPSRLQRHEIPKGYRVISKWVLGGLHNEYSLEREAA